MLTVFDLSRPGTDVFEQALTAAPFTITGERIDRDAFEFTTTGTLTAAVVPANLLDVRGEVFPRLNSPPT